MDRLPTNILANVYTFLPLKDQLRSRRLSTQFDALKDESTKIHALNIHQIQKNKIQFSIRRDIETKELQVIEITQKRNIREISVAHSNVEESGMRVHVAAISCPHCQFSKCIKAYIRLLFTRLSTFQCLHLKYLGSSILIKILRTLNCVDLNWEKRGIFLSTHRTLIEEEIRFLNLCRNSHMLRILTPSNFLSSEELLRSAGVKTTKILEIVVGKEEYAMGYGSYRSANIDLGIDDNFLRQMVDTKKLEFHSNALSKATPGFFINYIKSCLEGGYAMYRLVVHHKFDDVEMNQISNFMRANGFEPNPEKNLYLVEIKRKPESGYHPDQLSVNLQSYVIVILADYGCYRGKRSLYVDE